MNGTRTAVAPFVDETVGGAVQPERLRSWRRLTLSSAACITLLDAVLLQRKYGVFTGGFLAAHQFGTLTDGLAFIGLTALLNASLAAPVTLAAIFVGHRLRLRLRAVQFAAFFVAVLPLAIADFVAYQVWWYLGDAFDFRLMQHLAGNHVSEIFAVLTPLMSRPIVLLGIALVVISGLTAVLHRFTSGVLASAAPLPFLSSLRHCFTLVLVSALSVTSVSITSDSMAFALRWTPAGQLFTTVLNRVSDFDHDGYGLLRDPRDLAPFNSSIHPYAVDIPGNGIDENGLAGDLPTNWPANVVAPLPAAPWPERPPVVLFVLESLRADAVGAFYAGRRVTPVMDRLAAEGLKVDDAWSHNGVTSQSRYHILSGSLVYGRGSSSLLDDFKNHGYDVAYFSGQNDAFGGQGIDYRRIDKYYDARQDIKTRYSTSTTPGSLAVPLRVVEGRIREYLAERRGAAPLFVYVNFHDTHYPYSHPGLERLLGEPLLPPSLISPTRRRELHQTYLNAAANVDRAIGHVIEQVAAHVGQRPAVVIISDHGESLFEQGFLGHGYALNEAQTKIPLIVRGLPVTITMPFGQVDLRRAINEALIAGGGATRMPVARSSGGARVFQYLGTLDSPLQLGWMTPSGPFSYDFRSNRVAVWDGSVSPRDLTGDTRQMFQDLVHTFETMLLARNQTRTTGGETARPDQSR